MQNCGAQLQWIHLQNIPAPRAQKTLLKMGQRDCRSQRVRDFAIRLCLPVTSVATPIKSHQQDCPNVSWTRPPVNLPNWIWRIIGNWVTLGKSTPNGYPGTTVSPENILQVTLYGIKRLYLGIYVCTTTSRHSIIINEKEAINLKDI